MAERYTWGMSESEFARAEAAYKEQEQGEPRNETERRNRARYRAWFMAGWKMRSEQEG